MKKKIILLLWIGMLLISSQAIHAQRITRNFRNTSMSEALTILAKSTNDYHINFVYNELEDFTVTTNIVKRTAPDAIRQMMGFYPVKMTIDGDNIFVECTQKSSTKMMGRIVDAHHQSVDFANVVLLNVSDSTFITGGVTNENGQFVIPCEARKAIVKVSCVGYQTTYHTYVTGKIGTIALKEATMNLQKVVVKGNRKTFEMTNEGLVTQVTGTPLSEAGTANDIISQVPSVYGSDGKYSVYGKGEALIYVNGRKLTDNAELERISSKDIASIVLDNNPGAKYDAIVKSVILIKTTKKQGDGLSGRLSSMTKQARYTSLQDGGNLNWRKGGLDVFGSIYYGLTQNYQHQINNITVNKDEDIWQMHSDVGIFPKRWADISSTLGFNYMFNEHHSIGATYDMTFSSSSTAELITIQSVTKNGVEQETIDYDSKWNRRSDPSHFVNAYYKGEVGKLDIAFNNDLVVSQNRAVQSIQEKSSVSGESYVNSTNQADNLMFASKLVLSYPVGKGTVEAGGELIFTNRKDTYDNEEQIFASTDDHIKESKYAGFLSYDITFGKIGFDAGLRYEHTVSDYYEYDVWVAEQSRKYDNLFPNVGIAFPVGKVKFNLDYTMKTRRPSYYQLSSNLQYDDAFIYEKGNPLLKPETIHDITLSGVYRWIYAAVCYQRINDFIDNSIELQPGEGQPLNIFTYVNYPHLSKYTAVLSLSPKIGLWSPRLSMTLTGDDYKMLYNGKTLRLDNPQFIVKCNNSFSLPNGFVLTANMAGYTYGDNTISTMKPSWQFDLGVVKNLNRWTFQLQALDIFRTDRNSMINYGTSMLFDKWNYSDSQAVKLTVSYRFNTANSKYKGTGAGNEEKNRL